MFILLKKILKSLIAFVIAVSICVLVHEGGHFLGARIVNVNVYEFSVGFPLSKKIFTVKSSSGVNYVIRAVPLGGSVSFSKNDDFSAFINENKAWKRLLILLAGPLSSIMFGFVGFSLVTFYRNRIVNNVKEPTKSNESKNITAIIEEPAYPVAVSYSDMVPALIKQPVYHPIVNSLKMVEAIATSTVKCFVDIILLRGLKGLTGVFGLVSLAGEFTGELVRYLLFIFTFSVAVGCFNFLPIPSLDGAHVVFSIYEIITQKPFNIILYNVFNVIGFLLIILLIVIATVNDVLDIFKKRKSASSVK